MSGFFHKIKSVWPYIVYGFAAVVLFLVLYFPDRIVSSFVTQKFTEAFPGSGLSAEKIKITFPPGLELVNPVFSIKGLEEINADLVRIRPSVFSLIGISRNIHAEIRAFGGNALIDAGFKDLKNLNMAGASVKKVDLSKMPKTIFKGYDIKGIVDSEILLKSGEKGYDGKFSLNMVSGGVSVPFLSGLDLSPSTVNTDGVITGGVADIKKCVFTAGEFSGDVSGKVTISNNIDKSVLNLTVNVTRKESSPDSTPNMMIDAVFKSGSKKKIVVTGTIDNPKYSFN